MEMKQKQFPTWGAVPFFFAFACHLTGPFGVFLLPPFLSPVQPFSTVIRQALSMFKFRSLAEVFSSLTRDHPLV